MYEKNQGLVISLDLPLVGQILEASRETPCLCLTIMLDFHEIHSLMLEGEFAVPAELGEKAKNLFVTELDSDLQGTLIRLLELLEMPERIRVLGPLLLREIYYKLLLSEYSGVLRQVAGQNSQAQRIVNGLQWLRENAARTVPTAELAREVNMSVSTMHYWFKAVTSMSPLQFQKQLRLQEARRILLAEPVDATAAAQRVGYRSPSQFSRDYRRLFGLPPARDAERWNGRQKARSGYAKRSSMRTGKSRTRTPVA